jgi:hypothetical protein
MSLFSILPQTLFSPLASPGAPIYKEIAITCYDAYARATAADNEVYKAFRIAI